MAAKFYRDDISNLTQWTYYHKMTNLEEFKSLPVDQIKSSGYVVDSIEAAVWCLLNTDNLEECLLKAANLGHDTDTVAAIAGGLAGLYYGYDEIPKGWLEKIQERGWIEEMCRF